MRKAIRSTSRLVEFLHSFGSWLVAAIPPHASQQACCSAALSSLVTLELLACKGQPLLVRRDALLALDLRGFSIGPLNLTSSLTVLPVRTLPGVEPSILVRSGRTWQSTLACVPPCASMSGSRWRYVFQYVLPSNRPMKGERLL